MHVLTDGVSAPLSLYVYHGAADDVPGLLELPFDLFGLDLVQGAAGWRLFDSWPGGKAAGLGLLDARNVRLESEEELAGQLGRAAAAVGPENIHLSPSCGLEFLPRDVAQAKLRRAAQAAHAVQVGA
jgi:5-methyltetrahydropteroyltriglutamate--homocysteine methyltransferase